MSNSNRGPSKHKNSGSSMPRRTARPTRMSMRAPPSSKSNNNPQNPVLKVDKIDPPVETPGEWIVRELFPHEKSFGVFHCPKCAKRWYSAHAFKEHWQRCKSCNKAFLPIYMWLNKSTVYVPKTDRLKGEHDVTRCGACAEGKCIGFSR